MNTPLPMPRHAQVWGDGTRRAGRADGARPATPGRRKLAAENPPGEVGGWGLHMNRDPHPDSTLRGPANTNAKMQLLRMSGQRQHYPHVQPGPALVARPMAMLSPVLARLSLTPPLRASVSPSFHGGRAAWGLHPLPTSRFYDLGPTDGLRYDRPLPPSRPQFPHL